MDKPVENITTADASTAKVQRLTLKILLVALLAIIVLVGVRLHDRLQPVTVKPPLPLAVETSSMELQPFVRTLNITGTLEADKRVLLSAQLAARVESVPQREGAQIKQGDILISLDESEYRQEVARLEASVDRETTDLEFWYDQLKADRRLLKSQSISRLSFDETQRQVNSHSASLREKLQSLESARTRLKYAQVRAPFDGYIQTVHVLPGEFVQTGGPLLEVIATEPLKAIATVAEIDLQDLQPGQAAKVRAPSAGSEWSASVDRLYPALERGTRSATVELFLPSGQTAAVRPGMAAKVSIELSSIDQAIMVPRQAIRKQSGETGVFVLTEGLASWRPVDTGESQGGQVRILKGLQVGDELIFTPHPQLADGRPVVAHNDWRGYEK